MATKKDTIDPLPDTFLELSDVPGSYVGKSGKIVAVRMDECGLEFIPIEAAPPIPPGLLVETFEVGWFASGTFDVLATENFEAGWYTGNPFVSLFSETFESGGW